MKQLPHARIALEQHYADLLQEADDFDRKQVSYQGNKGEILHSWIKYREGFSAQLGEKLIKEFGIQPGDTLLEPFSGSATTLLVAQIMGINAVGIEILPVCHLTWEAKSYAYEYNLEELRALLVQIQDVEPTPAKRRDRGDINNLGVLLMVEGYFIELTFIFTEIFRTCRHGAQVAFVKDNVRYGGEVIPVDLLTTELAETLGFEPVKVYILPQRKGNSSQQIGRFGREALRKSITIWRKQ